jgi:lipoprotein-anchoring transpeptidase ErfK/SrfK
MKILLLFAAAAGFLLNSATPPAASEPISSRERQGDCAEPACAPATTAARIAPRLVYEPEEIPPPPAEPVPSPLVYQEQKPSDSVASGSPAPRPSSSGEGVTVVVSLPQQKAYVFDGGDLVATSPVSTGKKGYETPVGTFRILQKKVHHRSNRYSNAPMPYMQRLTWQGVALHAGALPGYPASHGCIRLPRSFAKKLYGLTDYSTSVTITRERPKSPEEALSLS